MLVSHARNFLWRAGHLRDLIPLLGDGLLTIDGAFHRTPPQADAAGLPPRADRGRDRGDARRRSTARSTELRPGEVDRPLRLDARGVALRVAMRALFGIDPDRAQAGGLNAAEEFESALSFYGRDYLLQILRGPRTPFAQHDALAPAAGRAHLRRDRPPPRDRASAARTSSRCCSTPPTRTARRSAAAHPRRGDDAAVRRATTRPPRRWRSCSTSWRATRRSLDDSDDRPSR